MTDKLRRPWSGIAYPCLKRLFDVIFSALLLVLSSPLWLITIAGISLSSKGPPFYVARRVGKDGREFRMYKFRSMHVADGADEKSLRPDESRIFKFGAFIRATKIDELPQILNVLFGQMTVVGPRPASKDQLAVTRGGKYRALYALKAGLTSPSALYDYLCGDAISDEAEYDRKILPTRLALDMYYLARRGLVCDIRVIGETAACIFCRVFRIMPKGIYERLLSAAAELSGDPQ